MKNSLKYTVAIPTYKRPDYLRRAVRSVLTQSSLPNELIIVSRVDDSLSNLTIKNIIDDYAGPVKIRNLNVEEPGFLPPIILAIDKAKGDVLVLLDDDAEAHPDWLMNITKYYNDPSVGGVGGRCINYFSGVLQHYPAVKTVGKLLWYGRSVGNMYCDCVFSDPVKVDYLMGGNLSYRLDVLRNCKPDKRIGNNVAFHWEMDVGQQVKHKGYSIIFDQNIKVDHHSAPREVDGLRTINYDGIYWSNYNYAFLMRKHLSKYRFASYLIYSFLFGDGGSPGVAYLLYSIIKGKPLSWHAEVMASFRGRLDGLRA